MFPLSKLSAIVSKRHAGHASNTAPEVSTSVAAASMPRRSKSVSFRSLLHKQRGPTTETVPAPAVPAEIRELAIVFVNSLTAERVSNFLAWFLFFDVVELPKSPVAWYGHIDSMDMKGWINLGVYLRETVDRGMDIVVLDAICDRVRLQRTTVHGCIVQLSDPQKMVRTRLASIVSDSKTYDTEVQRWEFVDRELRNLYKMAQQLTPTPESIWEDWRAQSENRLRGFLYDVVAKQLDHHRLGTQLLRCGTSSQLPKEAYDSFHLKYLFEAMQQNRQVPFARYGVMPESKTLAVLDEGHGEESRQEESFTAAKMRSEIARLTGENETLKRHNKNLIEKNEVLLKKLSVLGAKASEYEDVSKPLPPLPREGVEQDANRSYSLERLDTLLKRAGNGAAD